MKMNVYQFDILLYVFGILLELYYYILHRENPPACATKYQSELHGIRIWLCQWIIIIFVENEKL